MTAQPADHTRLRPETVVLHGGRYRADPATGAVAVPIYQTTSYQFRDAAHATRLFAMEEDGYAYTRLANPTHDALESRLAQLDGGAAALCLASGQAARVFALLNLAGAGDNIVASRDIDNSGWLAQSLARCGIALRLADPADLLNFARAADGRTKAYFAQTLAGPQPAAFPIDAVAGLGRQLGIPLIVDNSLAPLVCRPLQHGAAVTIYSAAAYLGGHGAADGGLIVDGGSFPWQAHKNRFALLTAPDDSYHGAVWTEVAAPFGPIAYLLRIRARLLRDFGAAMAPLTAFHILQGLETLALRMRQHGANALLVAEFLSGHPLVRKTTYPGLIDGPDRRSAERLLPDGHGGLVGLALRDAAAVAGFIGRLRLWREAGQAGEMRSRLRRFASPQDDQSSPASLLLSVGLEHPEDIIKDLAQALGGAR